MIRWRTILHVLGMFAGIILLAVVSMALIVTVARYVDRNDRQPSAIFVDLSTPAAPTGDHVKHVIPARPYAPVDVPNYPKQSAAGSFKGGGAGRTWGTGAGTVAAGTPTATAAGKPVGLSSDEYREAVASGKKLYLPNPQGECDLGGQNASDSVAALDRCLASRAAR